MTLAVSVGLLVAGAVFLVLQRGMVRIVLGFVLFSHAVNLAIMAAGGVARRSEPLGSGPDPAVTADPLPQAFVLTAIVIAFSITIYMLVLAVVGRGDDDTDSPDAGEDGDLGPSGTGDRGPAGSGDPARETDGARGAGATNGALEAAADGGRP